MALKPIKLSKALRNQRKQDQRKQEKTLPLQSPKPQAFNKLAQHLGLQHKACPMVHQQLSTMARKHNRRMQRTAQRLQLKALRNQEQPQEAMSFLPQMQVRVSLMQRVQLSN